MWKKLKQGIGEMTVVELLVLAAIVGIIVATVFYGNAERDARAACNAKGGFYLRHQCVTQGVQTIQLLDEAAREEEEAHRSTQAPFQPLAR